MVSLGGAALNGNEGLYVRLRGRALLASTKVGIQTRFFDNVGALIATHVDLLHSGSAGQFDVRYLKDTLPAGAVSWQARLVVQDAAATFSAASVDCFLGGGCNPPSPSAEPSPDDNGSHGCEECYEACSDFTAVGVQCPPNPCDATCDGYTADDHEFQAGVCLAP
jgi:hypothetical protein